MEQQSTYQKCPFHNENESKSICITPECQALSRLGCDECFAKEPHENHQNTQIEIVLNALSGYQKSLNEGKISDLSEQIKQEIESQFAIIQEVVKDRLTMIENSWLQTFSRNNIEVEISSLYNEITYITNNFSKIGQFHNQSKPMSIIRDISAGLHNNDENLKCKQLLSEKIQALFSIINEFSEIQLNSLSRIAYPEASSAHSTTTFDVFHFTNTMQNAFLEHSKGVSALLAVNDHIFASGGYDQKIVVFDLLSLHNNNIANSQLLQQSQQPVRVIKNAHNDVISCLVPIPSSSQSSSLIASGSWDKTVKVWNWENNTCLAVLNGHEKSVKCLLRLDEETLASGSEDRSIRLWNWRDQVALKVINNAHMGHVYQLVSLDGESFVSCSSENKVKLWNWQQDNTNNTQRNSISSDLLNALPKKSKQQQLQMEPDVIIETPGSSFVCLLKVAENALATGDNKGTIRVFQHFHNHNQKKKQQEQQETETETGDGSKGQKTTKSGKWREIKKIEAHKKWVAAMVYLNESVLASASWDNSILFVDWIEGKILLSLDGHSQSVFCLAVLNEKNLLSGSADKKIVLWK